MIQLKGQIRVQRLAGKINMIPSEGGGGPLQAKTAYPSHSEQVIAPDEDYYGLVAVTVKPVPRVPVAAVSISSQGANVVETAVNLGAVVSVYEDNTPASNVVRDMTNWNKNTPATNAYTSITYNNGENICQYTGVGMFEVIGIPVLLEAGKSYTFTVSFYTPNTLTGDYEEPYAPYIAFVPYSAFGTDANPVPNAYVHTAMALSMDDYITYTVTYTPNATVYGGAVFGMGSTTDGISVELRLKNITLTIA